MCSCESIIMETNMTFDLFTAHIFFDDAFEYHGEEGKANGYVKQLIRTIDVAIRYMYAS